MVIPPEAEPVSAASTLVATASETKRPPPTDNTHSRTIANAGSIATTAPNPTRLATVTAGNTEALAPASMLSRSDGSRRRLTRTSVRIAAASATATDHTTNTAAQVDGPQSYSH